MRQLRALHIKNVPNLLVASLLGAFARFTPPPPQFASKLSEKAKDFVEGLLTVDVNKRLDVKRALQHDFITQCLDGEFKDNLTPLIPQIGQMSKVREATRTKNRTF